MNSRVILVPQDAAILQDASTVRLHTYANGFVLVRTDAPVAEFGEAQAVSVRQGVVLGDVPEAVLEKARATWPDQTADPDRLGRREMRAALAAESDALESSALIASALTSSAADQMPTEVLAYVELVGPTDPAWLKTLRQVGLSLLRYQPENSYLCQGMPAAFQTVRQLDFVLHVTPLLDEMKPAIDKLSENGQEVVIVLQGDRQELPHLLPLLKTLPGVTIHPAQEVEAVDFYLRIRARIDPEGQAALLKTARVIAVEPFERPRPEDEVAGLILAGQYRNDGTPNGSYLRWLEDHAVNGAGVTIGIVDTGVDITHPAFQGRIRDLSYGAKSWHATFVAGHAAGAYLAEKDGNQYIYGLGMAPAANLLAQDNAGTPSALCRQTVTQQGVSGVAGSVQNNSWGKGTSNPMGYDSDEASYDSLVRNADPASDTAKPLTICFSSGNSGQAGLTRPKAAKNVIVTGNSENYRPDVGGDQSNDMNQVYSGPHASSWGNCGDGRIRPHVVAPGEWSASANYDSHPGDAEYISPKLTWGGGSSGASPKTAGACALLIDWWRKQNNGQDPSPALLRALIVNGAEPIASGGSIPNPVQGWGRLNLANILDDTLAHFYVDQTILLRELGDQRVWTVRVYDPKQPVKITLAWTDPPGPIGSGRTPASSPIINKLALRVEANGSLYRGNQFSQGWSSPANESLNNANNANNANKEGADNLQNVYLAPDEGRETVRVTVASLNITTNCLTGQIDTPQQDFALVISNGALDVATTPADVFVAIDQQANGSAKPTQPGDYWADPAAGDPGNNPDDDELQTDSWNNLNPAAPTPPNGNGDSGKDNSGNGVNGTGSTDDDSDGDSDDSGLSDEEEWWNQGTFQWSQAEAQRQPSGRPIDAPIPAPLAEDQAFVRGLTAGIDLLNGGIGALITLASALPANESGNGPMLPRLVRIEPETTRRQDTLRQATTNLVTTDLITTDLLKASAGVDLSQALANLLANWQHFGASTAALPALHAAPIQRRVAVLVVGAGTRIRPADLAALRQIAFLGTLYLVSADAQVLSFLAQRIDRRQGVEFRLAEGAAELPQLLRDTLAEAGGAQRLGVLKRAAQSIVGSNDSRYDFLFHVVEQDRHLTLRLRTDSDAALKEVRYRAPAQTDLATLDLDQPGEKIRILRRPGLIQLDIDRLNIDKLDMDQSHDRNHWAGTWQLTLRASSEPTLNVWATTDLWLRTRQEPTPASESGRSEPAALLCWRGNRGVTLAKATLSPPRIAGNRRMAIKEAPRDIVVTMPPSRLAREAIEGEQKASSETVRAGSIAGPITEPITTPSLSRWLPLPPPSEGASVVDLPTQLLGLDSQGNYFARLIRTSLLQLEPRSTWRQRLATQTKPIPPAAQKMLWVSAQLAEVEYVGGLLLRLRLRKGNRQRIVRLASPTVRQQLALLDFEALQKHPMQFAVFGNELLSLRLLLPGAIASMPTLLAGRKTFLKLDKESIP